MKIGVPYLALGIGLLTGTLFAFGQTPHPCLSRKRRLPCPHPVF